MLMFCFVREFYVSLLTCAFTGLYRGTQALNSPTPYVYTNPHPSAPLHRDDKVFILAQSFPRFDGDDAARGDSDEENTVDSSSVSGSGGNNIYSEDNSSEGRRFNDSDALSEGVAMTKRSAPEEDISEQFSQLTNSELA